MAQFHPLLTSLVNVAPCLAIDLPGCGCSSFELTDWEAYKLENLAALIATAIEEHRDEEFGQEVMIIGHSMGCSLAVMLASARSPLMSKHILGVIAICPRGEIPSIKEVTKFKRLLSIPGPIFDLFRWWDQRGGTGSASVARFVGPGAEEETKKLQVLFNKQSRTPVWRRMAHGMLPTFSESGVPKGGLPGQEAWAGLEVPVMLIAGEADKVTPAMEVEKIAAFLGKTSRKQPGEGMEDGEAIVDAAAPVDSGLADGSSDGKLTKNQKKKRRRRKQNNSDTKRNDSGAPSTSSILAIKDDFVEDRPAQNKDAKHKAVLKTTILPSPAAHSLLYAPSTARIIAGLIQLFLASHIDPRLSQGWQLQYLHTEGKWDVKNLVKWQGVQAVSLPIPGPSEKKYKLPNGAEATQQSPIRKYQGPVFRAMKTLREVDDTHSPSIFVKQWRGKIRAVVDISHESPVYDPQGLEKGGIEYHKFPTVSKLPPTIEEVKGFIDLIDRLRAQLGVGGSLPFTTEPRATPTDAEEQDASEDFDEAPVIGVHCHYGFNRTGFFVVCYLIDKLGFRLQDAIDEFERQRPPGIRHRHFVDQLFVRYCVGLKRAPTL